MIKQFIEDFKKEYALIVTPSVPEVVYIAFLVIIVSVAISLSIVGVDFLIGELINKIMFS